MKARLLATEVVFACSGVHQPYHDGFTVLSQHLQVFCKHAYRQLEWAKIALPCNCPHIFWVHWSWSSLIMTKYSCPHWRLPATGHILLLQRNCGGSSIR